MSHWILTRGGSLGLAAALLGACGGAGKTPGPRPPTTVSAFTLFAEGPCPKLSVQASGERRFIVYGDTGYDLHAWLPGEPIAAAQAIAELTGDQVFRNPVLHAGLPQNAGGYIYGGLELGGTGRTAPQLLLITTRYSTGGQGALFQRRYHRYALSRGEGWQGKAADTSGALPVLASDLPALPRTTMCPQPGLTFVPLASTTTEAGGVFVAGRCDDDRAPNYVDTTVLVAHLRPAAKSWQVETIPDADALDGIVNLDLAARSDDRAYLVAYEPFTKRQERQSFFAHYDGSRWREVPLPIDDGLMSVAAGADGTVWLAGGRALYRRDPAGEIEPVALPPLRFARGPTDELHIHRVRAFDPGELWVEASYRVELPAGSESKRGWASALYATRAPRQPLYCDAAEPAEGALYEVE
ncbi:MAG: hypothetical protein JRI68_10055 [Deltaproteobacteria bacterium]|nr:hypothetical protein [Deltaproteobacteria bacterium]